jgi:hypothetical protein
MPGLSQRERSIAAKFRRYTSVKDKAKELYDRADGILTDIVRQLEAPKLTKMREQVTEAAKSHHSIRISEDGKTLHVREAAADEKGILGWGHGAVRQFDPKIVNP